MTDRVWAAAGIFAALVAVVWTVGWWAGVFTRPPWLPRWRCVEGFWHWRKECDGHDEREQEQPSYWNPDCKGFPCCCHAGMSGEHECCIHGPAEPEAALDEAWAAELHHINADLHQPGTDYWHSYDENWDERVTAEQWDWRQRGVADLKATAARHAAEQRAVRDKHARERAEHRARMGLAA